MNTKRLTLRAYQKGQIMTKERYREKKSRLFTLCFLCAYRNLDYISEVEEDSMMSNIP